MGTVFRHMLPLEGCNLINLRKVEQNHVKRKVKPFQFKKRSRDKIGVATCRNTDPHQRIKTEHVYEFEPSENHLPIYYAKNGNFWKFF